MMNTVLLTYLKSVRYEALSKDQSLDLMHSYKIMQK